MNEIDEAKLTAYALGELDEQSRREIEARLVDEPGLRAEVEAIRAVAMQLREQLAAEAAPEVKPVTLKMPRRGSWRARLAIAAAVGVVVTGIGAAIWQMNVQRPQLSTVTPVASRPATRNVAELRVQAQRLINETRYKEATAVLDEMLIADPKNDYARGVRPLVQDKAQLQEQRRLREDFDRQFAGKLGINQKTQARLTEEKKTPYDDILRYPANWPDISEIRDGSKASQAEAPALSPNFPNAPTFNLQSGSGGGGRGLFGGYAYDAKDSILQPSDGLGDVEPWGVPGARSKERGFNTEAYDRIVDNAFLEAVQNPLSTFSIDVDTAAYSNMRRFLAGGQRPPRDAVRIEEMINYFPYDDAPPAIDAKEPFAAHVEVAACPWASEHRLVRVALKGKEIAADKRPASNLVFLLDVSGSMNEPNKLPLVKRSMRMLLEQLNGEDRVAIVVYAGNSGMALPSTACDHAHRQSIENAIEMLSAGGSTNGEQGIQLAYKLASENFVKGGTNRVILCTDGDFNVGVTNQGDLTRIIEEKAKGGVFLSVLGFGMGNLKDSTMEKLADKGNGNYAYIDTASEAKKVLVEQMSGTLVTIAKDVKIQIEFNPSVVGSYRLIGYENRLLAKEDFNDDKKDAGEIGAGHAVTALYEVVPAGTKSPAATAPAVDALKYQKKDPAAAPRLGAGAGDESGEMLTLKLRYKQPDGDKSALIEQAVKDDGATFAKASADFKFASAVAGFGMILRDSPHKGSANIDAVMEWAEDGLGKDTSGYRHEFIELVKQAKAISR